MGGRLALHLAIHHGDTCSKLIVESATAGIRGKNERVIRQHLDEKRAEELEQGRFEDFLQTWYGQSVFAALADDSEKLARVLRRRRFNEPTELARALRGMGVGTQVPLWDRLSGVAVPVLLVTGERDSKYVEILRAMAELLPCAALEVVSGVGHNVHVEDPATVAKQIKVFFAQGVGCMANIEWKKCDEFEDIKYEKAEGIAKITINRPQVRNAFRPLTVREMSLALNDARDDKEIGVIILTGEGDKAFCSGGDQRVRADAGYTDNSGIERLNVLDFQRQIRTCPKPIIAMVAGYAIGGGHVLHLMCDLTIAADNAVFGQTGPKVGSFDGGYGSAYMARIVGQKKAREIWFLCRKYSATDALEMGLVNIVVPLEELEQETIKWCREILAHSPLAIRCLKAALNADCDGQAGLQELAGNATLLFYMTEEAQEGRNAFVEKREPDFSRFPRRP